jgi:hypothetical protein
LPAYPILIRHQLLDLDWTDITKQHPSRGRRPRNAVHSEALELLVTAHSSRCSAALIRQLQLLHTTHVKLHHVLALSSQLGAPPADCHEHIQEMRKKLGDHDSWRLQPRHFTAAVEAVVGVFPAWCAFNQMLTRASAMLDSKVISNVFRKGPQYKLSTRDLPQSMLPLRRFFPEGEAVRSHSAALESQGQVHDAREFWWDDSGEVHCGPHPNFTSSRDGGVVASNVMHLAAIKHLQELWAEQRQHGSPW